MRPEASQGNIHPKRTMTRPQLRGFQSCLSLSTFTQHFTANSFPCLPPSHSHSRENGPQKVKPTPPAHPLTPLTSGVKPIFEFGFLLMPNHQPSGSHHLAVWQPHVGVGQDHSVSNTDKGHRHLRGAFISASLWHDACCAPCRGVEVRQDTGMEESLHDMSGETEPQRASLGNSSVQFPRVNLLSQKNMLLSP